jgi:methyl acetate hydrolase
MAKIEHFQAFLDKHVEQGTAPGLQGVVFNRDGIVFSGFSGLRSVGKEGETPQPMTQKTLHWIASCSKLVISIMLFRVLEQGYGKEKGITLNSLDDHEALIKILPEFKHGSGSNVTKIITGFSDEKDEEGKRKPILIPSKNKVTLRQLLTHSSGLAYYWNHPLMKEWYEPSDGSTPNGILAFASGRIADFEVPLVCEGNQHYEYGPNTDWLGQFIERLTGKNLRAALIEFITKPLGISNDIMDVMISKLLQANGDKFEHAMPVVRLPPNQDGEKSKNEGVAKVEPPKGAFLQVDLPLYEPAEEEAPAGFAHFASAPIHTNLETYAKILQASLIKDERLLSKSTWDLIQKDDITPRGVIVKETNMSTYMLNLSNEIKQYFDVDHNKYIKEGADISAGQNMLQTYVARVETNSGLSVGSYSWAGLGNTYYFVDPIKGVGGVFGTQLLPFYDSQMIQARYEWEKLITSSVA